MSRQTWLNDRTTPTFVWLGLILVGLVVRSQTQVMSPIHEQMHAEAVSLTGGTVLSRTVDYITWRGGAHNFILMAGYSGEVILYGLLALFLKRIGLYFYGALLVVGPRAVGSLDFEQLTRTHLVYHMLLWGSVALLLGILIAYRYWGKKKPTD